MTLTVNIAVTGNYVEIALLSIKSTSLELGGSPQLMHSSPNDKEVEIPQCFFVCVCLCV